MKSFSGLWGNHMPHLVDCYLFEDGLSSSPSPRRHPWTPRLLRPESGPPPSACCSLQDRSQQNVSSCILKVFMKPYKVVVFDHRHAKSLQDGVVTDSTDLGFDDVTGLFLRMFRWWHHLQWQRRGTGDWTMLNVRRGINTVLSLFTMLSSTNLEVRSWRETILFWVSSAWARFSVNNNKTP